MDLTPQIDPMDADLNQFEHDIRQLKIEYEQYFGGGKKRPPADIEWRIELMIKRHGDRGAAMNYGQRFRYSNLQQTYARYKDIFRKRMRRREEATSQRHFGSAARAIAAERAAQKRRSRLPAAVSCVDLESEPDKVDTIYNAFLECRASLGESTEGMSRGKFQQFLKRKMEELRRKAGDGEVEFVADVEGGKARLRARHRSTT
jgi:multidrug resistance efflux pump